MSKETREAFVLGAKITNTVYEVAADKKVNLEDLARVLPLILGAQAGIDGFSLIGAEQDAIGPAQKAEIRAATAGAMPSVPPADRDDWADIFSGILSGYRLGRRAGKKEAEQAILAILKEKGEKAAIAALEAA
ncbi:MAG: hypothetical protein KDD10_30325 [Phaeodactylibacter sp.]|nr:hypothetical protein [Phaeodactylibacter sp.]